MMLYALTHLSLRTKSSMLTKWMSLSVVATRALPSSLFYHKVCNALIIGILHIHREPIILLHQRIPLSNDFIPQQNTISNGCFRTVKEAKFTQEDIKALSHRIQFGGDEVVQAKDGAGSATLSMVGSVIQFSTVEHFQNPPASTSAS